MALNLFVLFLNYFLCLASAQVMDPSTIMFGAPILSPLPQEANHEKKTKKNKSIDSKIEKSRVPAEVQPSIIETPVSNKAPPSQIEEDTEYKFPIVKEDSNSTGVGLRNTVFGGDFEQIDLYRNNLSPSDIRKNIFELGLATQYFYNNSQSNYFYRNYTNNAPSIDANAHFWLTPFFALNVEYDFSLMDTVSNSATQNTTAPISLQTTEFGFKFRRFFSSKVDSASTVLGVNYIDHQLQAQTGETSRMSLRYRGIGFEFEFSVPSAKNYFWNFGFNIAPNLSGEESSGTPNITSGPSGTTLGYGGFVGGEYRFSRKFQAYFKFSADIYRTQFSGASRANDVSTGGPISNVSVTDGIYAFSLGFRIGK